MPCGLFNFFVGSIEILVIWCISAKENHYDLGKNSPKFQASVTERYTSLSRRSGMFRQNLLKVPVKKLNLRKFFTAHKLLHK